jgi:hypothetical protein
MTRSHTLPTSRVLCDWAHPEVVEEVFLRAILAHQELLSKHLTLHERRGMGMQGGGGLYMDQGTVQAHSLCSTQGRCR